MRTAAIIAVAIVLGLGVIYACVRWMGGDVQTVLVSQKSTLDGLGEKIEQVENGLPELQQKTEELRDSMIKRREDLVNSASALDSESQQSLLQIAGFYEYTEKDLTISLNLLEGSTGAVTSLKSIQDLLQKNDMDLETLLVEKPQDKEVADALRANVESRFEKADAYMQGCDAITEDLGKFILVQQNNWLNMKEQMDNLKSLAANDPDLNAQFKDTTLILEVGGEAITNSSNLHSFMETTLKVQRNVQRVQRGMLSTGQ